MPTGDRILGKPLSQEDSNALRNLFSAHYEQVLNYIRFSSDVSQPEDIAQDVFLLASLKIDQVLESQNPAGWLINTAKNCIRREGRSAGRFVSIDSEDINTENRDEPSFEEAILLRDTCKKYVSEEDWQMLYKFYGLRYSGDELAKEYGLTKGAFRVRLLRTRKILSEKLGVRK